MSSSSQTFVQCLTAVAQHHGLQVNPERVITEYALGHDEPGDLLLMRIASDIGLKAKVMPMTWQSLLAQNGVFPLIARTKAGKAIIVVGVRNEGEAKVAVLDPQSAQAVVVLMDRASFCAQWSGDVLLLKREHKLTDPNQPFGFKWFIPEILKQKSAFRDIFLAAMAMHVLGLGARRHVGGAHAKHGKVCFVNDFNSQTIFVTRKGHLIFQFVELRIFSHALFDFFF